MVPIAGSAYTYSYATLGELVAWIIGWDLIIEYAIGNVAVAISWSGYFQELLRGFGVTWPVWLGTDYRTAYRALAEYQAANGNIADLGPAVIRNADAVMNAPHIAGIPILFNLPAFLSVMGITWVLVRGVRESAGFNTAMVVLKLVIIAFFLAVGAFYVQPENWTPFAPNGFAGISSAAAIIFFAYIGFDAVSTAAEETKDPQRNMPIGMIGSLVVCTVIYMAVALVLTGLTPWTQLGTAEPLATAFSSRGMHWVSGIISLGAVFATTSVLIVFQMGQPRIFFSMARDGLLPKAFAIIHPKFRTPWIGTIVLGVLIAVAASMLPISILGDLVSLGTSFAFGIVCLTVMFLRTNRPDLHRPFRVPLGGMYVSARGRVFASTLLAFVGLAVFRFLMQSPWTNYGAAVVLIAAAIWLIRSWGNTESRYWIGTAPMLGILFAAIMAGPLIEDVIQKALADDPIPATIIGSYLALGAAIYLFYGMRNSRLAKGLDILEDPSLPGPLEAVAHGVDERR
jgi:APA family basic amino acid/polyamine antiporter